jgi:hypothetical protein
MSFRVKIPGYSNKNNLVWKPNLQQSAQFSTDKLIFKYIFFILVIVFDYIQMVIITLASIFIYGRPRK